jgi:hypothetical protein
MRFTFYLFFFVFLALSSQAQRILRGVIRDSLTHVPVPFAHVTLADHKTGITTDIDGRYQFALPEGYSDVIYITHVSYKPIRLSVRELESLSGKIWMVPAITHLREVEIRAGENPAWRLIRQAVRNKDQHTPLNYPGFTYQSYTKLVATAEGKPFNSDSLIQVRQEAGKPLSSKDSSYLQVEDFLKRNRIFVSESVTERSYQRPGKHQEKLLAHKISGFQSPLFASLPNDYQPLGFYEDVVTLLGKDYLNPVSKGSEYKYDFELTDTLYADSDTLYVIAYQPMRGTTFNGLRGKITIATEGYALKNIIAEAADPNMKISFAVQQNYERVAGRWFPSQLNTDLLFLEFNLGSRKMALQVRSYLSQIQFPEEIPRAVFKGAALNLALTQGDRFMDTYRPVPLDSMEVNTYDLYDSLRSNMKVFGLMDKVSEGALSNALPLGKVDLKLNQLLLINRWEGARLSLGLQTNPLFSRRFTLGGYGGYGFKDKTWKYGGFFQLNVAPDRDFYARVGYDNTLREAGVQSFFDETPIISSRAFRDWVSTNFDRYEAMYLKTGLKLATHWHFHSTLKRFALDPLYPYELLSENQPVSFFEIAEIQGELSYARNQRQVSFNGRRALIGFEYPVFTLQAKRALPGVWNTDDFSYTQLDALWMNQWKHRRFGRTQLTLKAGWIDGVTPFNRLYFGPGARQTDYWVDHYFQTMGINEFVADQYAAVFVKQNFGSIFFDTRFSKPELIISHAMAIGRFQQRSRHGLVETQSFEKGYLESGLGFNNLIRFNYADVAYVGFGGGVFYRYGPYQGDDLSQNLVAKLSFTFSF